MVQTKNGKDIVAGDAAGSAGGGGVSLGKGAWDCDKNVEIPPEAEVSPVLSARHPTFNFKSESCLLRCFAQPPVLVTPA